MTCQSVYFFQNLVCMLTTLVYAMQMETQSVLMIDDFNRIHLWLAANKLTLNKNRIHVTCIEAEAINYL